MKHRVLYVALAALVAVLGGAVVALAGGPGHACTEGIDQTAAKMSSKGWIGFETEKDEATGAYRVTAVAAGSPAERAGFQRGDLLVALNGVALKPENKEAVMKAKQQLGVGKSVTYTVARAGAEVVVFPELAFERFHPQRPAGSEPWRLAEPVPGPMTERFARAAREHGLVVVLNLYEREGQRAFDCSPVIDADGILLGRTRMVHITEYPCFHEQGYYAPGDQGAPVYRTKAGNIGVAICYDRHYPEYMRALALGGADLVVVPQAGALDEWPEGLYEGEMRVAAFHNGYFIALCNRVGREECLTFAGESFVCSPDGRVIARAPAQQDAVLVADIDLGETSSSHARRLFMQHRRPELYADWVTGSPAD